MSHRVTVHRPAARDCRKRQSVKLVRTSRAGGRSTRSVAVQRVPSRPACAASSRSAPVSAGALGDEDTRQPERATKTATEAEGGSGSVRAPGTPGQPHLRRSERCQRRRWDSNPRDAQSRLPVFKCVHGVGAVSHRILNCGADQGVSHFARPAQSAVFRRVSRRSVARSVADSRFGRVVVALATWHASATGALAKLVGRVGVQAASVAAMRS